MLVERRDRRIKIGELVVAFHQLQDRRLVLRLDLVRVYCVAERLVNVAELEVAMLQMISARVLCGLVDNTSVAMEYARIQSPIVAATSPNTVNSRTSSAGGFVRRSRT